MQKHYFSIFFSFILMFPFMHCPKNFPGKNKTKKIKHLNELFSSTISLTVNLHHCQNQNRYDI